MKTFGILTFFYLTAEDEDEAKKLLKEMLNNGDIEILGVKETKDKKSIAASINR